MSTGSSADALLIRQMAQSGQLPDTEVDHSGLYSSIYQAAGTDPNSAGKQQQLSQKSGLGPVLTANDPVEAQRRAAVSDLMERRLESQSPILARQLTDPNFANIAHDQLDNLSTTEKIFNWFKMDNGQSAGSVYRNAVNNSDTSGAGSDGLAGSPLAGLGSVIAHTNAVHDLYQPFQQGELQFERGMLGIKAKRGIATADDWNRIHQIDQTLSGMHPIQTPFGSWGDRAITTLGNMSGNMLPMVPRAVAVGAAGAGIGAGAAAAGIVTAPTLPAAALGGFGFGFNSEFLAQNYDMMAGNEYIDLRSKGVDENRAQWAAGTTAAVNTAFQAGFMRIAGKPLGDLASGALSRAVGEKIAAAMTVPTAATAIKSAVLGWMKNTAIGTGEMSAQTVVSRVGEDWAKQDGLGGTWSDLTSPEFLHQMGDSLVNGLIAAGTMSTTGSMLGLHADMERAADADRSAKFFTALSENAADSEVRKRNPNAYENFVAAQADGSGAETTYIDGQKMAEVLHQTGVDPMEVEKVVPGFSKQLIEAQPGGDVEIPTAKFAAHIAGTDLGNAMTEHMRLDPDAMSVAEAKDFQSKVQEMQAKAQQSAVEKMAADADFGQSAKAVEDKIYEQLKATRSLPADVARTNAVLHSRMIASLAAEEGSTPEQFYEKYKPSIERAAGVNNEAPNEAALEHANILKQSGDFGPVHDEYHHDAQGAVERLLADKDGEAVAALHHPAVGDIDLVYGKEGNPERNYNDGFGLAKIAVKHPEVLDDLQGHLDGMKVLTKSENRIRLGDDSGRAIVRLSRDGENRPWLLTAYKTEKEALSAAESGRTVVTNRAEPAPTPAGQEADKAENSVAQTEAKVKPGEILHQSETRGGFDPARLAIIMTHKADFSTFAHESAHYYLHVLADMAAQPDASDRIKGDMDTLLKWFGVKDLDTWHEMPLSEQAKFHEQFAYSFEKYLADGKAPTPELQGVFDRFSRWLKRAYSSVSDNINAIYKKQHGVDLPESNGEVKQVMDRMFASDEQIKQAEAQRHMEPLFKEKPEPMNDNEWAAYQEMGREASDRASSQLASASIRQMQWLSNAKSRVLKELQKQHDSLRSNTRDEVAEEVKNDPVRQAMEFLKNGHMTTQDGHDIEAFEGHKLDKDAVSSMFPESALGEKPDLSKLRGMTAEGGLHPDLAAEMFGFDNGSHLVRNIIDAKPIEDEIDARTDQRMMEKHGDLNDPESMNREVEKALHNEARQRVWRQLLFPVNDKHNSR